MQQGVTFGFRGTCRRAPHVWVPGTCRTAALWFRGRAAGRHFGVPGSAAKRHFRFGSALRCGRDDGGEYRRCANNARGRRTGALVIRTSITKVRISRGPLTRPRTPAGWWRCRASPSPSWPPWRGRPWWCRGRRSCRAGRRVRSARARPSGRGSSRRLPRGRHS